MVDKDLERVIDGLPEMAFEGKLSGKEPLLSSFTENPPIQFGPTYPLAADRSRFLQTVRIVGFDEPIHILYDYMHRTQCGMQMGTVLNKPVPRGIILTRDPRMTAHSNVTLSEGLVVGYALQVGVILDEHVPRGAIFEPNPRMASDSDVPLSDGLIPLELTDEQKWSYFNPLYAAMLRETDNAADSQLMREMNVLRGRLQFSADIERSLAVSTKIGVAKVLGALSGVQVTSTDFISCHVTYPEYLVLAPVGNTTVVTVSGCPTDLIMKRTSEPIATQCPGCHAKFVYTSKSVYANNTIYCQNCGRAIPVNLDTIHWNDALPPGVAGFDVPSSVVFTSFLKVLGRVSAIVSDCRTDEPVYSRIPGLGPLFVSLASYAANPNASSWDQFRKHVLLDDAQSVPYVVSKGQEPEFEIRALPICDLTQATRYAPKIVDCPRCGSHRYVSIRTKRQDGIVKCYECTSEFKDPNHSA